jgi:hypothetical protein
VARRLASGSGGGGDGIPARGQGRARVATAGLALTLAALVGAYSYLLAVRWEEFAAGLAVASVALLAAASKRSLAALIPIAVLLGGAAYGVSVSSRDPAFDTASIVVAALLLFVAELAFWSVELASPVRYRPALLARRALVVGAVGVAALGASALVAAAAAHEAERSLLLGGLGVAAAVTVVALFARLVTER